jgi:hypothetical protein
MFSFSSLFTSVLCEVGNLEISPGDQKPPSSSAFICSEVSQRRHTQGAMSESYQHVVKGGLKLKGGAGLPAAGGVGKKKKKKSKAVGKEVRSIAGAPFGIPILFFWAP